MEVTMHVECRKCPSCMRKRAAIWRYRAIAETQAAERSWFGTLTASPEHHYAMETRAREKYPDFDAMPEKVFPRLLEQMTREATLWLKRVRKNAGVSFRYLLVAEIHDGDPASPVYGRPHLHILVHEGQDAPIRKQTLQDAWRIGFTQFKLCRDVNGAMYLCKYLSKSMDARVRASIDYGNAPVGHSPTAGRGVDEKSTKRETTAGGGKGRAEPAPADRREAKPSFPLLSSNATERSNRNGSTCISHGDRGSGPEEGRDFQTEPELQNPAAAPRSEYERATRGQ